MISQDLPLLLLHVFARPSQTTSNIDTAKTTAMFSNPLDERLTPRLYPWPVRRWLEDLNGGQDPESESLLSGDAAGKVAPRLLFRLHDSDVPGTTRQTVRMR